MIARLTYDIPTTYILFFKAGTYLYTYVDEPEYIPANFESNYITSIIGYFLI